MAPTPNSRRPRPPTASRFASCSTPTPTTPTGALAEAQKALFTADARFAVYLDGEGSEPTYVLEGREALTPVFADLNRYEATTHFNGQSTVSIDGDHATGESYTIAHHLFTEDGNRKIMIASLRYLDTFAKIDGSWYFAERKLLLDWSETRPSTPGT